MTANKGRLRLVEGQAKPKKMKKPSSTVKKRKAAKTKEAPFAIPTPAHDPRVLNTGDAMRGGDHAQVKRPAYRAARAVVRSATTPTASSEMVVIEGWNDSYYGPSVSEMLVAIVPNGTGAMLAQRINDALVWRYGRDV